uniref:Uncharacterized protein n=1 Tax=Anguilla anguilla TaxID=7936 RepID=A0A0E9QWY7_ANGAN
MGLLSLHVAKTVLPLD